MCLLRLYLLLFHICASIVSCICGDIKGYGESCTSDDDCEKDLICEQPLYACNCQRYYWRMIWDSLSNRCFIEDKYQNVITDKRYDTTRDLVIPSIIFVSLAITASLCYRLFRVHKRWLRRRRANDMARALEEAQLPFVGPSPQPGATWIASYRVFGTVERTGPPPCLLLPMGPPSYEEALKHKVILSSYPPPMMHTTPL